MLIKQYKRVWIYITYNTKESFTEKKFSSKEWNFKRIIKVAYWQNFLQQGIGKETKP